MSDSSAECSCTGIRFCAKCRGSLRVQNLFNGTVPLSSATDVIAKQQQSERLSSCSFAVVDKSKYSLCIECLRVFRTEKTLEVCGSHNGECAAPFSVEGLAVVQDVLTAEEEAELIRFLDNPNPFPVWKESQSGRRKQDYGPRRNFKKKKVKPAEVPAMPQAFKSVFSLVSSAVEKCTGKMYNIAEVTVLEYVKSNLSNFDPHVDDTWLWGDRIAGLNLNEPCVMTFVNTKGDCCDVCLPRRSFFLMSGSSRYGWMHGIRPESIQGRRISLTFRELSDEILADSESSRMVLSAASTFL